MMLSGISKCNVKLHFSVDTNHITCLIRKGNAGQRPEEFFSKFVSQILSYDGYIDSYINDHTAK